MLPSDRGNTLYRTAENHLEDIGTAWLSSWEYSMERTWEDRFQIASTLLKHVHLDT